MGSSDADDDCCCRGNRNWTLHAICATIKLLGASVLPPSEAMTTKQIANAFVVRARQHHLDRFFLTFQPDQSRFQMSPCLASPKGVLLYYWCLCIKVTVSNCKPYLALPCFACPAHVRKRQELGDMITTSSSNSRATTTTTTPTTVRRRHRSEVITAVLWRWWGETGTAQADFLRLIISAEKISQMKKKSDVFRRWHLWSFWLTFVRFEAGRGTWGEVR